jgi:hypothetical protein
MRKTHLESGLVLVLVLRARTSTRKNMRSSSPGGGSGVVVVLFAVFDKHRTAHHKAGSISILLM